MPKGEQRPYAELFESSMSQLEDLVGQLDKAAARARKTLRTMKMAGKKAPQVPIEVPKA